MFTFGLSAVILPAVWVLLRPKRPYPHAIDICIVMLFLLDTAGNALDLYDAIEWFDAMHYLTWIPFGLLIITYVLPIPPWAAFGVGARLRRRHHILWEIAEFYTFIKDGPEEATAYRDTLGDLFLSLCGSVTGALIVSVSEALTRSAT